MKKTLRKNLALLYLYFVGNPSRPWKANDGCDEWSKLEYIYFFSFCSNFEPLDGYRMSRSRKYFPIAHLFSTPRTHLDRSKTIEIWTTRREATYRKDHFDYSIWFRSVGAHRTIEWSETLSHSAFIFDSSETFRRLEVYWNFYQPTTESPSERYFRLLGVISISRS